MKVGILLPAAYDLAALRKARALAGAVLAARPLNGKTPTVAIGLPQGDEILWRRNETFLRQCRSDIVVRHLVWENVPAANAHRMYASSGCNFVLDGIARVTVPRDWGANFADCDVWFNLADPALGAVHALRPTAHFVTDLAMRRVPYAYAHGRTAEYWSRQTEAFRMWRQNGLMVASDQTTAQDLISYAGVAPDRIKLLDQPIWTAPARPNAPLAPRSCQLLWRVDPTPLYDFASAARALRLYLAEGGGLNPVIATQVATDAFGAASNLPEVVHLPRSVRDVFEDLPIERIVSQDRWGRLLGQASGLWDSRIAGGEGVMIRDGDAFGLPVLAADVPVQRATAAALGAQASFYPPDSADAMADALHQFEASIRMSEPKPAVVEEAWLLALEIGFVLDRLAEMQHG